MSKKQKTPILLLLVRTSDEKILATGTSEIELTSQIDSEIDKLLKHKDTVIKVKVYNDGTINSDGTVTKTLKRKIRKELSV